MILIKIDKQDVQFSHRMSELEISVQPECEKLKKKMQ